MILVYSLSFPRASWGVGRESPCDAVIHLSPSPEEYTLSSSRASCPCLSPQGPFSPGCPATPGCLNRGGVADGLGLFISHSSPGRSTPIVKQSWVFRPVAKREADVAENCGCPRRVLGRTENMIWTWIRWFGGGSGKWCFALDWVLSGNEGWSCDDLISCRI